jgi:hypothetical protein
VSSVSTWELHLPKPHSGLWSTLRSIKTLETINAQPTAEFWKEVDAKRPAK